MLIVIIPKRVAYSSLGFRHTLDLTMLHDSLVVYSWRLYQQNAQGVIGCSILGLIPLAWNEIE